MYIDNIKNVAELNQNFRAVLYTGAHSQVVAMSIPVGEEIGTEVHPNTDQIICIVEGKAEAQIDSQVRTLEDDDLLFVKAGSSHNIRNVGDEELKLFTIYSPPHHTDGLVQEHKI